MSLVQEVISRFSIKMGRAHGAHGTLNRIKNTVSLNSWGMNKEKDLSLNVWMILIWRDAKWISMSISLENANSAHCIQWDQHTISMSARCRFADLVKLLWTQFFRKWMHALIARHILQVILIRNTFTGTRQAWNVDTISRLSGRHASTMERTRAVQI